MKRIDKTVLKETAFVAAGTVLLSVAAQIVFAVLGRWDIKVLSGNLLSAFAAILNFFLMGITVQLAMVREGKDRENFIRLSLLVRTALLFGIVVAGVLLPYFNLITVFVPLFFPRIVIMFRPVFMKKGEAEEGGCKNEN